jgi:hypothetical protein
VEQFTEQCLESLPDLLQILVTKVMQIERENNLNAKTYKRIKDLKGYANGY